MSIGLLGLLAPCLLWHLADVPSFLLDVRYWGRADAPATCRQVRLWPKPDISREHFDRSVGYLTNSAQLTGY
jgi:hypothetical protein